MSETRTIAVPDVAAGMQVKAEGLWWEVCRVVDNGSNTGTMTVMARRAHDDGRRLARNERLLWLPITRFGVTARAGYPSETTVSLDGKPLRVVYRPSHVRDPQPYVDGNGARWSRRATAAWRLVQALGDLHARRMPA
jgi:hypothetical protein